MANLISLSRISSASLTLMACAIISIIAGCGGGGGGGSDGGSGGDGGAKPPAPIYLQVSSVDPANGKSGVETSKAVSLVFNEEIISASLLNENIAVGKLIKDKLGIVFVKVEPNTFPSTDDVKAAFGDPESDKITIGQLKNMNESSAFVPYYIDSDNQPQPVAVSGVEWIDGTQSDKIILKVDSVLPASAPNAQGGLIVNNQGDIEISTSLLAEYDLLSQSVIKVSDSDSKLIPINIDVVGKTVILKPLAGFWRYTEAYKVSVSTGIRSKTRPEQSHFNNKLQAAYNSSFSTIEVPDAKITSVSPIGANQSVYTNKYPFEVISNFDVATTDAASMAPYFSVSKLVVNSKTQELSRVPVELDPASWEFVANRKAIRFRTLKQLDYLSDYEIVVKGTEQGYQGVFNGTLPAILPEDYVWKIQTAAPGIEISEPANNSKEISPYYYLDVASLKFNFPPNIDLVNSALTVTNVTKGKVVSALAEIDPADDHRVLISIDPAPLKDDFKRLDFSSEYQISLAQGVVSALDSNVVMNDNFALNFTTVDRKVEFYAPFAGDMNVNPNQFSIDIEFNFRVDKESFNKNNIKVFSRDDDVATSSNGIQISSSAFDVSFPTPSSIKLTLNAANSNINFKNYILVQVGEVADYYNSSEKYIGALKWNFRTASKTMDISEHTPKSGAFGIESSSVISVKFNTALNVLGLPSNALVVREASGYDCDKNSTAGQELNGEITYNTDTIIFTPNEYLGSWCKFEVTVSADVEGVKNESLGDDYSWTFETTGLEYISTNASYYKNTEVVIADTEFTLSFNKPLSSSQVGYEDFKFCFGQGNKSNSCFEDTFYDFDVFVSGSNAILSPFSGDILEPGLWYYILIQGPAGSGDGVVGLNGETLEDDETVTFKVEPPFIEVTSNFPVGNNNYNTTSVGVNLNISSSDIGFPVEATSGSFSSNSEDNQFLLEVYENGSRVYGEVEVDGNNISFYRDWDSYYTLNQTYKAYFDIYYPDIDEMDSWEWEFTVDIDSISSGKTMNVTSLQKSRVTNVKNTVVPSRFLVERARIRRGLGNSLSKVISDSLRGYKTPGVEYILNDQADELSQKVMEISKSRVDAYCVKVSDAQSGKCAKQAAADGSQKKAQRRMQKPKVCSVGTEKGCVQKKKMSGVCEGELKEIAFGLPRKVPGIIAVKEKTEGKVCQKIR